MKRVLIVAFHFPPFAGSSGFLRTLKFCRYLPEFGWLPIVLTAHPRAYERLDPAQLRDVPEAVHVIRAFALDTQRHLSIRGRYPKVLGLPDRWVSWALAAVPTGLGAILRHHVDAIISTYPIVSAVLAGWLLHRLSGLPWVLDLRDPITEDAYPPDPTTRRVHRWIESKAARYGSHFLFTAASTMRMYFDRYPDLAREKCKVLPNGYDEEDFQSLIPQEGVPPAPAGPVRLLHTGILYPEYRHPRSFFAALARLKGENRVHAGGLKVQFRAAGFEQEYERLLRELDITDLVEFLPPLPYHASLRDAAQADGLILAQGAPCNHQIPAKTYEYLRLRRPILALTPGVSDTAALLRDTGGATIVDLDDEVGICHMLPHFLRVLREGRHPLADARKTACFARKSQAQELSEDLNRLLPKTHQH